MKKIIALTLLLMFLISSACMASPYIAYVDTSDDREWEQSFKNEWKQYREERAHQARIQAEKEEQERLILIQQRKQQEQMILLWFGAVAVIGIACLYIKRKNIHKWVSTHVTIRKTNSLQISQILLIGFLLTIATIPHWRISDGFYTLLRILATIISVWSALRTENNILRLIFAFIAILFNPIILIELDRDEWEMIDVATAIFYLGIVIHSLIKARK